MANTTGKKWGGRQKGKQNKVTEKQRQDIEWALSIIEPRLEKAIASLSDKEACDMWQNLQEYIRPKLMRAQLEHSGEVQNTISTNVVFSIKPKG